jgi:AraC family transcriptional regulator, transcriptional activator FtrA
MWIHAMSPHRVVALVHAPQSLIDLALAAEVFSQGRPFGVASWYEFVICAVQRGSLRFNAGYEVMVTHNLTALDTAETVIIPGWGARDTPAPSAILDRLRHVHSRGIRILALYTGAFLLAEAGMLSGRRATTHWRFSGELAARYPDIEVVDNVLYIDHGDIATCAGMAAGIDLFWHIVRTDHGAALAADVARRIIMSPHRGGMQAQRLRPGTIRERTTSLAMILEWAASDLSQPLTVTALASRARMSTRTFARRFQSEVGTSPGQWVLDHRLNAARELLEQTDLSIEVIAKRVGFSSAVNLRRHLRRLLDMTPATYRRDFRRNNGASHANLVDYTVGNAR